MTALRLSLTLAAMFFRSLGAALGLHAAARPPRGVASGLILHLHWDR